MGLGRLHIVPIKVPPLTPFEPKAQTHGKVRVTFEENSGLAVVVPVESILSAIAEHLNTQ